MALVGRGWGGQHGQEAVVEVMHLLRVVSGLVLTALVAPAATAAEQSAEGGPELAAEHAR